MSCIRVIQSQIVTRRPHKRCQVCGANQNVGLLRHGILQAKERLQEIGISAGVSQNHTRAVNLSQDVSWMQVREPRISAGTEENTNKSHENTGKHVSRLEKPFVNNGGGVTQSISQQPMCELRDLRATK